ncbi:hypothetical protein D3C73_652340 [compost metagenome]
MQEQLAHSAHPHLLDITEYRLQRMLFEHTPEIGGGHAELLCQHVQRQIRISITFIENFFDPARQFILPALLPFIHLILQLIKQGHTTFNELPHRLCPGVRHIQVQVNELPVLVRWRMLADNPQCVLQRKGQV